jgi:curved DNA-binding protein CbpA
VECTYYDVLGVPEDCTSEAVRSAYKQAASQLHPDRIPPETPQRLRDYAAESWLEVQEAYTVLSDPESRNSYDALLAKARESGRLESQFTQNQPPGAQSQPQQPQTAPWLERLDALARHAATVLLAASGLAYLLGGAYAFAIGSLLLSARLLPWLAARYGWSGGGRIAVGVFLLTLVGLAAYVIGFRLYSYLPALVQNCEASLGI